jgi:hypothetical protein
MLRPQLEALPPPRQSILDQTQQVEEESDVKKIG